MRKNDNKRYDSKHRMLKNGETERSDGYYVFRWTDRIGKRHAVTAKTLEELRRKEDEILRDKLDGIRTDASNVTVNDIYDLWRNMKRGLKDNTFSIPQTAGIYSRKISKVIFPALCSRDS